MIFLLEFMEEKFSGFGVEEKGFYKILKVR